MDTPTDQVGLQSRLDKAVSVVTKAQNRAEWLHNHNSDLLSQKSSTESSLSDSKSAADILHTVGLITFESLRWCIANPATDALATVFDEPYTLSASFETKKEQIECVLELERDGVKLRPLAHGGLVGFGAIDVAEFGMRLPLTVLEAAGRHLTILWDEPFRHLKGSDANERALEMVKNTVDSLGCQLIMVSDERIDRGLTLEYADNLIDLGEGD